MQNNGRIAGILSIISGAFGVMILLGVIFMFLLFAIAATDSSYYHWSGPEGEMVVFLIIFYAVIGGFFTLLGVLAIIGGIFAIKRRNWGLALAGAIAATLTFFPCGIPAIVFVALAKPEFEAVTQPIPPG